MIVLASGASSATQDAVHQMTEPYAATADSIRQHTDTATNIAHELSDEAKKEYVFNDQEQTTEVQKHFVSIGGYPMIILACFGGVALLWFVFRKTSSSNIRRKHAIPIKTQSGEVQTGHNPTDNDKNKPCPNSSELR